MAKIIFAKFPKEVKGEMIQITGKRIPSSSSILNTTKEAVKRLLIKGDRNTSPSLNPVRSSGGRAPSEPEPSSSKRDLSFHVNSACHSQSSGSSILPPVLCVTFRKNNKQVTVNCLLNTGSCRTYLSSERLKPLGRSATIGRDCEINLATILGECSRKFTEVVLEANVVSHCPISLSLC